MFHGKVIRGESIDPEYKVKFSFEKETLQIQEGFAFFIRQSPAPKIVFDDYTDYLMEKSGVDDSIMQNIRLEIGKTVCDYIFNTKEIRSPQPMPKNNL